jgi:hypothetical protein
MKKKLSILVIILFIISLIATITLYKIKLNKNGLADGLLVLTLTLFIASIITFLNNYL